MESGKGIRCLKNEEIIALTWRVLDSSVSPSARVDVDRFGRGTAFLLNESHLVTCAHVISAAEGDGRTQAIKVGTRLMVMEAAPDAKPVSATLCFYQADSGPEELRDIAILKLDSKQHRAVPFSAAAPQEDAQLYTFGFPSGHKMTGGSINLRFRGQNSLGWLQVDRATLQGTPLCGGVSGAPVWHGDRSAVVGMISLADEQRGVAHIIPYKSIRRAAESVECLPRIAGPDNEIFESLLKLDFHPQIECVFGALDRNVLAMLLTGGPRHGHHMLIERIRRYFKVDESSPIRVEIGRVTVRVGGNTLHGRLSGDLDLDEDLSEEQPERVYEALTRRLVHEDTVILIYLGEQTQRETIHDIVNGFWRPLVRHLQAHATLRRKLLAIIVDEHSCRDTWGEIDAVRSVDQLRLDTPLELPKLTPIDEATLRKWLLESNADLLQALSARLLEKLLYEDTESGVPEMIFKNYCRMRAQSWLDMKQRWLKR